jgi:2-oxoglutarate dehydrogenase E2 component (dihydrolipoamide succinyltransferase)
MATKVVLPEMGEGVTDATIIRWLKSEGEKVEEYEALVEVNTDKVDTEVPSPVSGTLLKIMQAPDTVVSVGEVLVWIGNPGEQIPEDIAASPAAKPIAETPKHTPVMIESASVDALPAASVSIPFGNGFSLAVSPLAAKVAAEHSVDLSQVGGTGPGGQITKQDVLRTVEAGGISSSAPLAPSYPSATLNTFISPVVARLSAEHGIDLTRVSGTGKEGRITKKDIERVISAGGVDPMMSELILPAPVTPAASDPASADMIPGTVMKLGPVRRSIAKHMVESKHTSPHVSTFMEIDMDRVWAHRQANKNIFAQDGAKLTFTAYFVSAVVNALKTYPMANSSWSDDGIIIHKEINIGMATSLGMEGLIVPVIKNADSLSLLGISRVVNDLAERARSKNLNPDEVKGGTFTITNHGTSGSLFATPIINQPQCAILSTGSIQKRAVVINDAIAIRPMVYLGLTFDHRILDGAVADYFLGTIKKTLEEWS